jgi:hypothetical protein
MVFDRKSISLALVALALGQMHMGERHPVLFSACSSAHLPSAASTALRSAAHLYIINRSLNAASAGILDRFKKSGAAPLAVSGPRAPLAVSGPRGAETLPAAELGAFLEEPLISFEELVRRFSGLSGPLYSSDLPVGCLSAYGFLQQNAEDFTIITAAIEVRGSGTLRSAHVCSCSFFPLSNVVVKIWLVSKIYQES